MEQSSSTATTSSSSLSSSQRGRELQGSRPAPLRVRRDSHRIRKPPPAQVRQPVIIYTASPKVVHAQPSEFMSVVQRLTGAPASSLPPPPPLPLYGGGHHHLMMPTMPSSSAPAPMQLPFQLHQQHQGPVSSHELIQLSPAAVQHHQRSAGGSGDAGEGPPPLPSILSPVPGSLPAIPPSFFSPPAAGGINLFGELVSPAFHGAATSGAAGAASPNYPTTLPSPSAGAYYWDLFNNHHQNL